MASILSEPSTWLPGFDPDDTCFPDLFLQLCSPSTRSVGISAVTSIVSAETIGVDDAVLEQAMPARRQSNWYTPELAAPMAVRSCWPALTTELLGAFGGAVAKYESNIAAIALLREL